MGDGMNDILAAKIRRSPPLTQEDCIRLAVRHALAAVGPVEDEYVRAAAKGIARGLFKEFMAVESPERKEALIDMCEHEYRSEVEASRKRQGDEVSN